MWSRGNRERLNKMGKRGGSSSYLLLHECFRWWGKKYARRRGAASFQREREKKPPQGWSPVLIHSLKEPPQEEEEEGSQAGIPEMIYTVAVLEKRRPALQANSLAVENQSWRRQRKEPCRWKMQPAFSPLCFVSARISSMQEERSEEREEDGQAESLCAERCDQADVPFLSQENRPMGFDAVPHQHEHDKHQQHAHDAHWSDRYVQTRAPRST